MASQEDVIEKIIEIEWRMFQAVPNLGGRAACQEDFMTFEIMRFSQAMSWSGAVLESYLDDLTEAEKRGRNLLTEKYARMMKSTSPLEYARMEHLLPPLNDEVLPLIDEIVKIVLEWEEVLEKKFPYILKKGRPIHRSEDTPFVTSLETYLRGELSTYSLRTLQLYHEHLLKLKSENINGSEITLAQMVKQYGYPSLEEANEKLKPQTYQNVDPSPKI
jgi:hypothetical protein